jgi:hypothetical protein
MFDSVGVATLSDHVNEPFSMFTAEAAGWDISNVIHQKHKHWPHRLQN